MQHEKKIHDSHGICENPENHEGRAVNACLTNEQINKKFVTIRQISENNLIYKLLIRTL